MPRWPGDLVYVLGVTRNELGGIGVLRASGVYRAERTPCADRRIFCRSTDRCHQANRRELVASVHGVYRGGLGVHLALVAMGGGLGMTVDLGDVPSRGCSTR